nr:S1 RNA-binding domain-containing protein [Candidatus Gracilibacteria bacterium]
VAGIKAFLPVSQLSPENYPRVDNANTSRILEKLQSLVAKPLKVRVIGVDKEEGKLIFSERQASAELRRQGMAGLKVGDVLEGRVTGVIKFGIFVSFNELEGLVHISEIAWGHVKNPSDYAKIGDVIKVKVIGIDHEKISLSIKQLQEDPWISIVEKYKVGTVVKGIINKVSDFGAFVTIAPDVNGLVHLSEIDHSLVSNPNTYFKEGQEIEAKVIDIDLKEHRIALSTKALKPAPEKKMKEEKEAEEAPVVSEVTEASAE